MSFSPRLCALMALASVLLFLPPGAAAAERGVGALLDQFLAATSLLQRVSTYRHRPPRDPDPQDPQLGAYCRLVVPDGDDQQECTGAAVLDGSSVLTAAHCFFEERSNAFLSGPYTCTYRSGKPDAVAADCRLIKLGSSRPYEAAESPNDYAVLLCDPVAPVPPLGLADIATPADLVGATVSLAGYSGDMNDDGLRISEDRDCRIAHLMKGYYTTDCGGWVGASGAPVTLLRGGRRLVAGTILGAPTGVRHDIPFDKLSDEANIAVPLARFRADLLAVKQLLERGALK